MIHSLPSFVFNELHLNQAMTIFVRHAITSDIVDCYCVGATTKAALLLGYKSADEMYGVWLSKTLPLETGKLTRRASILRHYGVQIGDQEVPSMYVCDILRPDGSTLNVVKRTNEITYEDKTYWVTHLEDATGEQGIPHIMSLELPEIPPDLLRWSGSTRIVDIESLVESRSAMSVNSTLTTPESKNNIDLRFSNFAEKSIEKDQECVTTNKSSSIFDVDGVKNNVYQENDLAVDGVKIIPVDFSDAHTLILQYDGKKHYVFWCRVCDNFFRSLVSEPRECTNKGCKSKAWSTLDKNSGWLKKARQRYFKTRKK